MQLSLVLPPHDSAALISCPKVTRRRAALLEHAPPKSPNLQPIRRWIWVLRASIWGWNLGSKALRLHRSRNHGREWRTRQPPGPSRNVARGGEALCETSNTKLEWRYIWSMTLPGPLCPHAVNRRGQDELPIVLPSTSSFDQSGKSPLHYATSSWASRVRRQRPAWRTDSSQQPAAGASTSPSTGPA